MIGSKIKFYFINPLNILYMTSKRTKEKIKYDKFIRDKYKISNKISSKSYYNHNGCSRTY